MHPPLSSEAPRASGTDPDPTPTATPPSTRPELGPRLRRLGLGLGPLVLVLLPPLAAIWATPWFITQDGPAHLYNAQILAQAGQPRSPFREVYRVRWDPLPNWVGHLALAALLQVVPARAADRIMTSLTLAGFAASVVWLRWRVVGWRGMPVAAVLAALLAMNLPWLLGFTSFMLGACLFPITLGIWWHGRERLGPRHVAAFWALTVLGYFCHLVSLGLTVIALAILAVAAPGGRRVVRAGWTALGLLPLVPLGATYLRLTRQGGPMHPVWAALGDPRSLAGWSRQLAWADPLSLAKKVVVPFHEDTSLWFLLAAPLVVFLAAMALEGVAMATARSRRAAPVGSTNRRVWGLVAAVLIVGGVAGPDTLGPSHGNYLPQRVVLLGLAALVPLLDLEARSWPGRAAAAGFACAVALQAGFLWEYGTTASRNVGALMRSRDALGTNQRVATLLVGIRGRFRSNPLLHADCLLGIGTGNILWSNYETRYYYFPVQLRAPRQCPDSVTLEKIAVTDDPRDEQLRAGLWSDLLQAHHDAIDKVLVWGRDPALDRISLRWFVPVHDHGKVRVFGRREP